MRLPLLALPVLLALFPSCALFQPPGEESESPEGDDDQTIVSSSVQLRKTPGGRVLELSRRAELGEVMRILQLLGKRAPRKITLVVENGPRAEILVGRRKPQSQQLAVGFGPDALLIFSAPARDLDRGFLNAAMSSQVSLPLTNGKPDWDVLTTSVKVARDVAPQLRGLVVAAAPGSDAVLVVEAVQRLSAAATFPEGATLVPW